MTLSEALAIEHAFGRIGYPNKAHTAALKEAREVIQREATAAVERHWHSTSQGSAGHSGATESTGSASSDAAVRPANSSPSDRGTMAGGFTINT
jgi:hypothetical protein